MKELRQHPNLASLLSTIGKNKLDLFNRCSWFLKNIGCVMQDTGTKRTDYTDKLYYGHYRDQQHYIPLSHIYLHINDT